MLKEHSLREPLPFGKPSKSFHVPGFARRYGLFIVVIASFLFTMLVPVVLFISKPNYEVHALMRIDPVIPSLITTSEDPSIINYYQDYANTQARRMMDFEVLKRTVEKLTPAQKASILPANLPADKCADILPFIVKVNPVPGTHLIDLMASSPKKSGLAPLLNHLMQVFLEKVRNANEMQDNERLVFLRNERQSLSTEIATLEDKLNILTKDIATADYSEDNNLARKKTEVLQTLALNAYSDQVSSENNYSEVAKAVKAVGALSLNPMVEELVMNDQSLHFTSSWTYQQQQQLRATTDGLTANNPDRIYVEERMKAMRSYEKKLQNEVRKSAKTIVYGKRDYEKQKELIEAKSKSEKARKTEADIQKELDKSKEEAVRVSLGLHIGESLNARLKHSRDLLDRIDTRIHELEVEGKAPLRISVESSAREPDRPKGSNTQKLLMGFFAFAFGSVGGIFLIFDFFDNRIRRAEEIKQALGYPPVEPIMKVPSGVPFHRLLLLSPDQPAATAINSLAVRFDLEKKKNDARVILFTGVDREVGATTLGFNCAQALSRISSRVLFIEANFENPVLGTLTEISPEPSGLGDFLSGTASLRDYIVSSREYSTDMLYAGKTREKLVPRHRFTSLIEQVRSEYDFVCIDSSPVLESDMTEFMALSADIVALISLGESTNYKDLRRAAERLIRLDVPAIAPVLNWGGNKRVVTIDKLLANPPGFLKEINTKNLEEFIRNLPPASGLMMKLNEIIGGLNDRIKTMFTASGKKKDKKSRSTRTK
jgi:polysaccharide biosynthesis transport protein